MAQKNVKRVCYIVLWAVGALVLAWVWYDYTLGLTMTLTQRIGGEFRSDFLMLLLNTVIERFPVLIGCSVLVLGVFGVLPGTRQQRPP